MTGVESNGVQGYLTVAKENGVLDKERETESQFYGCITQSIRRKSTMI